MSSFKIKKSHNSSIHLLIAVVGIIFASMSIAQGTAESINQYLEEIDLVEANVFNFSLITDSSKAPMIAPFTSLEFIKPA